MSAAAPASATHGRQDAAEAIHIENLHKKFGALHVLIEIGVLTVLLIFA